jgi:hypothetical protein
MSGAGTQVGRRRLIVRGLLAGTALMVTVGAIAACWWAWSVRRVWDRLDAAAEDFDVPAGFTEVARLRQGTAFCVVTCTHGGEALVTMVFETDFTDPADACPALRAAIVELTGDAADASYGDECGTVGDLGGSASVFAGAGHRQDYRPHDGNRWTDAVAVPDSPVIAYVEFNSGIE